MKPCLCQTPLGDDDPSQALCFVPFNLPVILESSSKTLGGLQLNPVTRLDRVQIQLCYLGHWSYKAVWVWWWRGMLWCSPPSQPPPHTSSTNCAQSQEHFQLGVFHLTRPRLFHTPSISRICGVLIIRYFISIFLVRLLTKHGCSDWSYTSRI